MKLSNNAIKFLMAQYRAIYKNAYFKGLATAVVLTAGLATGQAQAADLDTGLSNIGALDTSLGDSAINASGNGTVEVGALTMSGSGTHSIKADTTSDLKLITKAGTSGAGVITLNSTGKTAGSLTIGSNSTTKGTSIEIDINELNVTKGTLKVLSSATSGSTSPSAKVSATNITISGAGASDATVELGDTSSSGNVVLGKAATAEAAGSTITLGQGTIKFAGGTADKVSIEGKLASSGATAGTIQWSGAHGTLKTWGTDVNVKLQVDGVADSAAKIALTDIEGTADDESVLSIKSGSITLGSGSNAGKLTLVSGTLDLDKSVEMTKPTDSGGTLVIGSGSNSATLKATKTQLNALIKADSPDHNGKIDFSGSAVTTILLKPEGDDTVVDVGGLKFGTQSASGAISAASTKFQKF